MLENLDAIQRLELPVDVVQLDDGYQTEIGGWLSLSRRFASLHDLVARIRDRGHRAGNWVAPFLAGERSRLYAEHPEWLVRDRSAGVNWHQRLFGLDVTHPGAAEYLYRVFSTLGELGFDFFKIDFVHAGPWPAPATRTSRRSRPTGGAAAGPGGDRSGRLPAGLRRTDPAQRPAPEPRRLGPRDDPPAAGQRPPAHALLLNRRPPAAPPLRAGGAGEAHPRTGGRGCCRPPPRPAPPPCR
jgi:hypothetical protein